MGVPVPVDQYYRAVFDPDDPSDPNAVAPFSVVFSVTHWDGFKGDGTDFGATGGDASILALATGIGAAIEAAGSWV